jgi:hypothetical protein
MSTRVAITGEQPEMASGVFQAGAPVAATCVTQGRVGAWVTQQARNVSFDLAKRSQAVKFLIRDIDTRFTASFDEVFRIEGVRVIRPQLEPPGERVRRAFLRYRPPRVSGSAPHLRTRSS